jgi:hypothetical protein
MGSGATVMAASLLAGGAMVAQPEKMPQIKIRGSRVAVGEEIFKR